MSTQIPPPPKRQRTIPSLNTIDKSAPAPTIVAQFKNAADGSILGPSISLPADTSREGLELLVNNLRGSVSRPSQPRATHPTETHPLTAPHPRLQSADPLPFSFHLRLPKSALPAGAEQPAEGEEAPRIAIHNSVHADLLLKHSTLVSTEDVFVIECEPEAVFRVREITRCSSSIDG